jgi:acyl-homoserine lactone acylase PvdQ
MALPTEAPADVAPYGSNDAGGFRNVLPAGENGFDSGAQLIANRLDNSQRPPHFDDQLPLYTGLMFASPTLTRDQIPNFFKDATFGVKNDDVESVETPRPGLTIVRDKKYGVPHIYGQTRADVMFGTGWVGAQDRLFLMDVLRHTARGQLSSFAGGSAGDREMDRTQWAIAPYTEADLQSQVDNAVGLYGAAGQQVKDDANEYVAGVNAYIAQIMADPVNKLPAEYAAIGKTIAPWTVTDVLAEASLIGGIFGKGGGNELNSALTMQAFERRFGTKAGRAAWSDFREKDDPEAPTTVSARFPYETTSPFATRGLALPDPGSVSFTPTGPPVSGASRASARSGDLRSQPIPNDGSIGSQLLRAFRSKHASNWELVAARNSTNGHPIAVMGPQVGYYLPEILMEEDLHGPGIDARGAAFPGVNQYVQLGHGRDYAWSATTATSDNVDTFAEVLCQDDFHYLYKGQCLAMEKLDRTNSWTPNALVQASGSETLTAYRTVHGIVYARGTSGGHKVAFVSARTTYFHEADSALGFIQLNDPNFITSPQRFQHAASNINFAFNWSYVDPSHIAYYQSGWYPQRAAGTSPDFPVLGTGEFDWQGYNPALHTLDVLPYTAHPNVIDPQYLVSWNNKQAPGWAAADDHYAYGAVYRSQLIETHIRDALRGGRKMSIEQLVSAMDEPATEDIRPFALWPTLKKVLGTPSDPRLRSAISLLDGWYRRGFHRRDLDRNGAYDDDAAVTLMDAWWPRLLEAEFKGALGDDPFNGVKRMLAFGDPTPGGSPSAPDFADGWYGYVSKDLRDLLAKPALRAARSAATRPTASAARKPRRHRTHRKRHPVGGIRGQYSRIYCGSGSLSACRGGLLRALSDALGLSKAAIYGSGDCAGDPQASCFDQNRWTSASGISVPSFPLQNRPTFQQVIELTHAAAR